MLLTRRDEECENLCAVLPTAGEPRGEKRDKTHLPGWAVKESH